VDGLAVGWQGEVVQVKVIWAEIAWWGPGGPCSPRFLMCGRRSGRTRIYRAKASVIVAASGTPTPSIDIFAVTHMFPGTQYSTVHVGQRHTRAVQAICLVRT